MPSFIKNDKGQVLATVKSYRRSDPPYTTVELPQDPDKRYRVLCPSCGHGDWNEDTAYFACKGGFACNNCDTEYLFNEI